MGRVKRERVFIKSGIIKVGTHHSPNAERVMARRTERPFTCASVLPKAPQESQTVRGCRQGKGNDDQCWKVSELHSEHDNADAEHQSNLNQVHKIIR